MHMTRRGFAVMVLVSLWCAVFLGLPAAAERRTPPPPPKEEPLTVVLRADSIVSPAPVAEGAKRIVYVTTGVRIKLTVKSEDKTYKFSIEGKSGSAVTVEKNKASSPVYFQFTNAGEEHEVLLYVGETKVSSHLFLRAK